MSFASASPPAPRKRPGKQNRPRFGLRGSTEATKASALDGARRLALRPVIQAENGGLGELPCLKRPKARYFTLSALPPCFPGFGARGGEAKTAPKDRFYLFEISKRFWSGQRNGIQQIWKSHLRRTADSGAKQPVIPILPATDSDANQPPNPIEGSHPLRVCGAVRGQSSTDGMLSGSNPGEQHASPETVDASGPRSSASQTRCRP